MKRFNLEVLAIAAILAAFLATLIGLSYIAIALGIVPGMRLA